MISKQSECSQYQQQTAQARAQAAQLEQERQSLYVAVAPELAELYAALRELKEAGTDMKAVALSLCFRYIPGLNTVSSGFVIIICGVVAAAAGALLFPVREDAA